jgi:hypothetical protein
MQVPVGSYCDQRLPIHLRLQATGGFEDRSRRPMILGQILEDRSRILQHVLVCRLDVFLFCVQR